MGKKQAKIPPLLAGSYGFHPMDFIKHFFHITLPVYRVTKKHANWLLILGEIIQPNLPKFAYNLILYSYTKCPKIAIRILKKKGPKIASSDFMTKKRILNLTFFIEKNNAYTLI